MLQGQGNGTRNPTHSPQGVPGDLLCLPCRGCTLYIVQPLQPPDLLYLLYDVLPLCAKALVVHCKLLLLVKDDSPV
jgi:hypothetical protein